MLANGKIFITIPSYEDPFLQRTLDELFTMADNPEDLSVAIAVQHKRVPQPNLDSYLGDINFISYDVEDRPGVNRLRSELLKFYKDEDYYLMIDSHMRFEKSWDSRLKSIHSEIEESYGDKVIWSESLPQTLGQRMSNIIPFYWMLRDNGSVSIDDLNVKPALRYLFFGVGRQPPIIYPSKFLETSYASCHFFFTRGSFVSEVGINPIAELYEEEPFLAYSSYLSGWRIFATDYDNFIAHDNTEYNHFIYGPNINSNNYVETKVFGSKNDNYAQILALDLALLFNIGPAKVKNPKITPREFYEKFGLAQEHSALCSSYMNQLSDIRNEISKDFEIDF